jgi:urease accessory protein
MTEIAKTYLGNIQNNLQLSEQLTSENCLEVHLDYSDRYKGRIHVHTDSGVAIGIIKSRDHPLQTGDLFQTDSEKLVLIRLQEPELLVLDLATIKSDISPVQLVNLGHALGNHHYPIAIKNNKIYVQLITNKSALEKLIKNLNIPNLQINYERVDQESKITFSSHSHS